MATHFSTLASKIPWMEELGAGYYPWGLKELGMTERLYFRLLGRASQWLCSKESKFNAGMYWELLVTSSESITNQGSWPP